MKLKKTSRVSDEIHRHLQNFAPLGPRDKLHYLLPRIRGALRDRTSIITKKVNRLRTKGYLSTGRLLPASLRSAYIIGIYQQAFHSYRPRPYSGGATLVKSPGRYRSHLDWTTLITGELPVHQVEGDHVELKTANASSWATRLNESLVGLPHERAKALSR